MVFLNYFNEKKIKKSILKIDAENDAQKYVQSLVMRSVQTAIVRSG